jgi:hypothetical protein
MLLHGIVGDSVAVVGLLKIESMANALCVGVAKTEGVLRATKGVRAYP